MRQFLSMVLAIFVCISVFPTLAFSVGADSTRASTHVIKASDSLLVRFNAVITPDTSGSKYRWIGRPGARFEMSGDTVYVSYLVPAKIDTSQAFLIGRANLQTGIVDSTKTGLLGAANFPINVIDSTKVRKLGNANYQTNSIDSTQVRKLGNVNYQTNSIDSTQVRKLGNQNLQVAIIDSTHFRAAAVSGANLATNLGNAHTWLGRQTFSAGASSSDSLIVTSGNFRSGTSNFIVNGSKIGIGTVSPSYKLEIKNSASDDASSNNMFQLTNSAGARLALVSIGADTSEGQLELDNNNTAKIKIRANGLSYINHTLGFVVGTTARFGTEVASILAPDDGTGLSIKINATQANVTAADQFLEFRSTGGVEGNVAGTATAGLLAYNTFTGGHYAQLINDADLSGLSFGMIVSATGSVMHETTEYLPVVTKTSNRDDPAVYGVFAGKIADAVSKTDTSLFYAQRDSIARGLSSKFTLDPKGKSINYAQGDPCKNMYQILAVGSGLVLVTDTGGNITVGDFISPSFRPGYGERQTVSNLGTMAEDILRRKTVAKSVVSVDWSTVPIDVLLGFKKKLIPCVYK